MKAFQAIVNARNNMILIISSYYNNTLITFYQPTLAMEVFEIFEANKYNSVKFLMDLFITWQYVFCSKEKVNFAFSRNFFFYINAHIFLIYWL